jgi:hypothetical protein
MVDKDNRPKPDPLPDWLERERSVSVPKAAYIKGISEDTFERIYPHLIDRPSPRRRTVKIKNIIGD